TGMLCARRRRRHDRSGGGECERSSDTGTRKRACEIHRSLPLVDERPHREYDLARGITSRGSETTGAYGNAHCPGARLDVARLPLLPIAVAANPWHAFASTPATRIVKPPVADAVVLRVTSRVDESTVMRTRSAGLKPAPRNITGSASTSISLADAARG